MIEDINTLSENRYAPYFAIDKREDKQNKKRGRHYSVERFVKIAAIYLLQEPGSAKAAKEKYIKQDTQRNCLKITDSDKEDIKNDIFLKRYTPFITVDKVFTKLSEKLILAGKKQTSQVFQNIFNYSAEFLTAYMVWIANNKNNEDFTGFPKKCDLMNEAWLDSLINEYGKIVFKYLTIIKGLNEEEIDSNLFKKDSTYRELREYLDKNCDSLQRMIEGIFDITAI